MTVVQNNSLYIGQSKEQQWLLLKYANRHGLIAGATGTGKTLSLQGLAEGFSQAGVPVFIADVKGDLSGLAASGVDKASLVERAKQIGFPLTYQPCPTIFWDVFGKKGHPVRTTISEMGPLMMSRLLDLNDTQEGVLTVAFTVADQEGLLLLDLDDLRAMLNHLSENAAQYSAQYGNVTAASVASIQRALLTLETQGGKQLFGEPALAIADLLRVAPNGQGAVNILAAETLMQTPKLYSMLLLWLLSELYQDMPEVGDMDKPKLVFFFDEAHLLFTDAPKALVAKIEQMVRLIRSKGVGIYLITQNPAEIPETVLGQLSNRVQHALRAFTPLDQKGVKAAAQTFRANPSFDTEDAITTLAVGEALVSVLDEKGSPTVVQKTLIRPPLSLVGPITDELRASIIAQSPVKGKYEQMINRESAYEKLSGKAQQAPVATTAATNAGSIWGTIATVASDVMAGGAQAATGTYGGGRASVGRGRQPQGIVEVMAKSVIRSAGSQIGREVVRGLLGAMLKR